MEEHKTNKNWYDKRYKIILIIPLGILLLSLVYLGMFYSKNGDFMNKDVSLKGGTTVTIHGDYNADEIKSKLQESFPDINTRTISDLTSGRQIAVILDSSAHQDEFVPGIEEALGIKLTEQNSNIEFSGPSLGEKFYSQLIVALIISFLLMSIVIFIMFRSFVPSMAVIFSAFADIVMPLALLDFLGVRISAAGIAAFLMLVGYSVDTDILLTTRVLKKRGGSVNHRIYHSFKTGMFMTTASLLAVLPAFFVVTGLPDSFRQIFLILALGLCADIINTWMTNASIIKWYAEVKNIQ